MNELNVNNRSDFLMPEKRAGQTRALDARQGSGASDASDRVTLTGNQGHSVTTLPVERAARVDRAVVRLNEYVQSTQRDLRFSVDEELGDAVITVLDRSTQEVIRTIPSDVAIQLAHNLKDLMTMSLGPEGSATRSDVTSEAFSPGLINTHV